MMLYADERHVVFGGVPPCEPCREIVGMEIVRDDARCQPEPAEEPLEHLLIEIERRLILHVADVLADVRAVPVEKRK